MLHDGLVRQRRRYRGDPEVRLTLARALGTLREARRRVGALRSSEFWTWGVERGAVVALPYQQAGQTNNEANPLQAWSNTR